MKAIKWKALFIGMMIATSAATMASNMGPVPSAGSPKYAKEHKDIRNDLKLISAKRAELADLKAECKADKKAKLHTEVIVDKKEISKTKADLHAAKRYLAADTKDLERDHLHAIKEKRKDLVLKRNDLCVAKHALRKDLRTHNGEGMNKHAAEVARLMAKKEVATVALKSEKSDYFSDMFATWEEIYKSYADDALALKAGKKAGDRAMASKED